MSPSRTSSDIIISSTSFWSRCGMIILCESTSCTRCPMTPSMAISVVCTVSFLTSLSRDTRGWTSISPMRISVSLNHSLGPTLVLSPSFSGVSSPSILGSSSGCCRPSLTAWVDPEVSFDPACAGVCPSGGVSSPLGS